MPPVLALHQQPENAWTCLLAPTRCPTGRLHTETGRIQNSSGLLPFPLRPRQSTGRLRLRDCEQARFAAPVFQYLVQLDKNTEVD